VLALTLREAAQAARRREVSEGGPTAPPSQMPLAEAGRLKPAKLPAAAPRSGAIAGKADPGEGGQPGPLAFLMRADREGRSRTWKLKRRNSIPASPPARHGERNSRRPERGPIAGRARSARPETAEDRVFFLSPAPPKNAPSELGQAQSFGPEPRGARDRPPLTVPGPTEKLCGHVATRPSAIRGRTPTIFRAGQPAPIRFVQELTARGRGGTTFGLRQGPRAAFRASSPRSQVALRTVAARRRRLARCWAGGAAARTRPGRRSQSGRTPTSLNGRGAAGRARASTQLRRLPEGNSPPLRLPAPGRGERPGRPKSYIFSSSLTQ